MLYMRALTDWVSADLQTRLPILIALIGVASALVGGLFTTVFWPLLKAGIERLGDAIGRMSAKRAFEVRYLEHLISEHMFLPILPTTLVPVAERQVHELDRLYVSLTLTKGKSSKQTIDIATAFSEHPRLVVLGEPGSGKTTMLRLVALTLARVRRGRPISSLGSKERLAEAGRIAAARVRMRDAFGFSHAPLPVFLYLNRLQNVRTFVGQKSLVEVIKTEWDATGTLAPVPSEYLQRRLDRGECVLLFDAFDELGTQENRAAAARFIGELAAAAVGKGNRVIVTSREQGYSGQLAEYGFATVTLQPLSWPSVGALVRRWYDSLQKPVFEAEQLLYTLKAAPKIAELATNPMLLSLIVLVQYVRGVIPERRHVLYDECIKILVERRYAPPAVQQEYNARVPGDDAIRLLRDIAIQMHEARVREVPRGTLEDAIIPSIVKNMQTSPLSVIQASELLTNIENRSHLIVERGLSDDGQGLMAFSHLTFQEYLASVALRDRALSRSEADVTEDLLCRYADDRDWWEEVALLYAAQLHGAQQKAFLDRLLPASR